MNEVSTNLPVIAQSSVNPKDETVKTYYRPEISYDNYVHNLRVSLF